MHNKDIFYYALQTKTFNQINIGLDVTVELTFLFHVSKFLNSNLNMETGAYYQGSCDFPSRK
jgi:hypothetical protein